MKRNKKPAVRLIGDSFCFGALPINSTGRHEAALLILDW